MFLSFIIPLYNCEQYIIRCLDSICNSGLRHDDYEIIVINDGSTDDGAMLCERYTRHEVKVFSQPNGGQATARNNGIRQATGDYLWFVDADDVICPEIVPHLYCEVSSADELDMITFNYQTETPDGISYHTFTGRRECFKSGLDFLNHVKLCSYLWHNIYKRLAISTMFIESISHIEDMCFNVQNVLHFNKILLLGKYGYVYNRTNVSSTSNMRAHAAVKKGNQDAFRVYSTLYQQMCDEHDHEKKEYIHKVLNFGIVGHIYTMCNETSYQDITHYIQEYKKLGLYPVKETDSKKANAFRCIANHRCLLRAYYFSRKHFNL